jgi:MFS transporter, DHA2 family, methylenomycin A resistance protein
MSTPSTAPHAAPTGTGQRQGPATAALGAAVLGFFVITFDALVVTVALPAIHADLGGGISGLQWVLDGYTLMFAALLLSTGAISDRTGAHRAYARGMAVFVVASAACGLAPNLAVLIAARLLQGAGAATILPASLSVIREAFPDPARRTRAIAVWTIAGSIAATLGPVLGGALSLADWRLIFFINLPIGITALILISRAPRSPRRDTPIDLTGLITAVLAMGGLTYGAIEAGARGFGAAEVLAAFATTALALGAFATAQTRGRHPMLPPGLLRTPAVLIASGSGFAFTSGLSGTVFIASLYLQQERHLSALSAGLMFVPMTFLSAFLSVPTTHLAERFGPKVPIVSGLTLMGAGLGMLAVLPASAPLWLTALGLIPVGICGPLAMQPTTAVLLESVPAHQSGIAGGVFNTSRQIGGALAVAVFGALLARSPTILQGLRISLLIAMTLALAAAASNLLLTDPRAADRRNSRSPRAADASQTSEA